LNIFLSKTKLSLGKKSEMIFLGSRLTPFEVICISEADIGANYSKIYFMLAAFLSFFDYFYQKKKIWPPI